MVARYCKLSAHLSVAWNHKDHQLELPHSTMVALCKPTIDKIVDCVKSIAQRCVFSAIVLAGGFGNSYLLL